MGRMDVSWGMMPRPEIVLCPSHSSLTHTHVHLHIEHIRTHTYKYVSNHPKSQFRTYFALLMFSLHRCIIHCTWIYALAFLLKFSTLLWFIILDKQICHLQKHEDCKQPTCIAVVWKNHELSPSFALLFTSGFYYRPTFSMLPPPWVFISII